MPGNCKGRKDEKRDETWGDAGVAVVGWRQTDAVWSVASLPQGCGPGQPQGLGRTRHQTGGVPSSDRLFALLAKLNAINSNAPHI